MTSDHLSHRYAHPRTRGAARSALARVLALALLGGFVLFAGPAWGRTVIIDGFPPMLGQPEEVIPDLEPPEVYLGTPETPGVEAAGGPQWPLGSGAGTISGTPPYIWRHGCGPTAAGMVIAFWDGKGFPDLVPGDASSQTAAVNTMMASQDHYDSYSYPEDDFTPSIIPDKSELGGAHTSNSVADFMHTSWSGDLLRYGWTKATTVSAATYGISYGMKAYTLYMNPSYDVWVKTEYWKSNITSAWSLYTAEIDAGRPMVLLVDTDSDGATDHFVPAVGYSESGGTKYYICYNTWDLSLHTYQFRATAPGIAWGVAYGSYYRPTHYTISGTITEGGSGLAGVTVTAGSYTTTTAGDGTYTLTDLPPATYAVTPTKTGYTFSPSSSNTAVGPSQSGVNFTASTGTTYSISGTITSGGSGLGGVTVSAGGGYTATTAGDGTYTISGLAADTYTITPTKSEYTFSPVSAPVTVGPDSTGNNFTATLNTYTISGTITSGGPGLAGVTVTAGSASTTTAGDGTYTLSGLVAGTYSVTPTLTEYTFAPTSLSVTVGPNAADKVFVGTEKTYTISGTITVGESGLGGVTVDAGGGHTATTASNGVFTVTGLVASDYTLVPSKAEYTFSPTTRSVTVGPNASGKGFTATQVTYTISGTITISGTGLSGVTVDAGGSFTTTTAGDGTYTLTGLTAETYTVTPSKTGYTFTPADRSVAVGPSIAERDFTATSVPETFSISGTVTSGGAPLSGVTLDAGGGHTAVTGGDGTYTISGLSVGLYTVTPSKAEYTFTPTSRDVNVGGQGGVTGIGFAGTQVTYAISGTVTSGGSGLSGVTVSAGGGITATTASDGTYTISGLVAGSYTITASRVEYTFSPTSTGVTVGPSAAGNDFTATVNTYTISGTVTSGGAGLAGVTLSAGGNTATTAGDGTYTITGLLAGSHTITPSKAGYVFTPTTLSANVGPSVTSRNFTAEPTYTVSGSVEAGGSGLAGVTVTIGSRTVTTDASGNYAMADLTSGTYTITPSKTDYQFTPASRSATVGPDATDQSFAATQVLYSISGHVLVGGAGLGGVTVEAGGQTATTAADGAYTIDSLPVGTYTVTPAKAEYTFVPASLSVTVGPSATDKDFAATQNTYTISGTVSAGGSGLSGVTITASGGQTATTGSDGTYSVTGLVAGAYTLGAVKDGYTLSPASLSVTVGPSVAGQDFTASAVFSISGRVLIDGAGLAGATVTAGGQVITTGADGAYTIEGLLAGTYTVSASKGEHTFSPASHSVTLGPSATDKNFAATLNTYSVSGTITAGGAVLAGVTVSAGGATATTGADGGYALSGLTAGTYVVTVAKPEFVFSPESRTVTVGPDAAGKNFAATQITYTIDGSVLLDGAGVDGVVIAAGGASAVTGADGSYVLTGLVAGTYTVEAEAEGLGLSGPVVVTVGPAASGVDFEAYPTYSRSVGSGWSMVSVPVSGVTETMGALLGDPSLNAAYWDPVGGQYVLLTGPPSLGRAYWIRPPSERTLTATGALTADAQYSVALQPGWQMVGNPFLEDAVDWSAVRVRSGTRTYSLDQAVSSGLVTSYGWVYDPNNTTYQLLHATVPGALRQVAPWQGFFVLASQPVDLVMSRAAAAAAAAVVPLTRSEGGGFTLSVAAQCEGSADVSNTLGVSDGHDAFQRGLTADEPPQLERTVNLSFVSRDTGRPIAVDIRSAGDGRLGRWTWDAVVRTDIPRASVTLTAGDLRGLPRDYQITLTDLDGGRSVFLRTTPSYTFQSGEDGSVRHIRFEVSRREAGLRIMGMNAQMVRGGGVSVAYSLSAPARVTARVLNAAGRVIAEPLSSDAQSAGARDLLWNGRSIGGSRAPAGAYTVELQAVTDAGERASAVVRVHVDLR